MSESGPLLEFHAAMPPPPLAAFVESIWRVRGPAPYRRAAVLPNGALQLMVNFGDPHRLTGIGGHATDRRYDHTWIAGLQEQALMIEAPACTDLLSIRFRPGGAHAFLPLPLCELSNLVVDARDIVGGAGAQLREQLAGMHSWPAQVACVQRWLLGRLQPRERDHALVVRAIAAIGARQGRGAAIAAACDELGLSNRHLIQLFRGLVGLPPKTLARVQRFHRALLRLPSDGSRAQLAAELGFADQAHFTREFRAFAGVAPGQFLERRGADEESLILG